MKRGREAARTPRRGIPRLMMTHDTWVRAAATVAARAEGGGDARAEAIVEDVRPPAAAAATAAPADGAPVRTSVAAMMQALTQSIDATPHVADAYAMRAEALGAVTAATLDAGQVLARYLGLMHPRPEDVGADCDAARARLYEQAAAAADAVRRFAEGAPVEALRAADRVEPAAPQRLSLRQLEDCLVPAGAADRACCRGALCAGGLYAPGGAPLREFRPAAAAAAAAAAYPCALCQLQSVEAVALYYATQQTAARLPLNAFEVAGTPPDIQLPTHVSGRWTGVRGEVPAFGLLVSRCLAWHEGRLRVTYADAYFRAAPASSGTPACH
jgi:hypothetical protein